MLNELLLPTRLNGTGARAAYGPNGLAWLVPQRYQTARSDGTRPTETATAVNHDRVSGGSDGQDEADDGDNIDPATSGRPRRELEAS